ncbi:MAG: diguanylate cyclase [Sedimenticola sp.]
MIIPGVLDAFRSHDREKLYRLLQPTWELLKEENPKLGIMHFHKADGLTLLRMHRPEVYDDPIATLRPFLARLHLERKELHGLEAGKHGVFMRVAIPVFDQGEYLGAAEVGINVEFIASGLRHMMGDIEGFLFIDKDALSVLNVPYIQNKPVGDMVLWGREKRECACLDALPDGYEFPLHSHITDAYGRAFIVHAFNLPVIQGSPKAILLLFQDVSSYNEELWDNFYFQAVGTALLILVVLFAINMVISPLMTKVAIASYAAEVDSLTQVYNRKKFDEQLGIEIGRSRRYNDPLSLLMFDIDHFKPINDTHGHKVGDDVLKELSRLVSSEVRGSDLLARWGGEEFMVILPSQDLEHARVIAEKLRGLVEDYAFPVVGRLTLSFGVTSLGENDDTDDLLHRVDANLYRAKEMGRNCVVAE